MYGCDRVPEFKTTPVTTAYEGSEYSYTVKAVDPDGKSISYFLLEGPEGMQIVRGDTVTWTPTYKDYGDHTVKIKADDSIKHTIQEFTLTVHYQITGLIAFLNLSDERLYPNAGLTVNVTGGNINASAVSDSSGIFRLENIPAGEYRYDILSPDGQAWSFYASKRELTFIYPARIWWGDAVISGTLSSNLTGTRTLSLGANQRTLNMESGTWAFRLDGLYPTYLESIAAKQNKTIEQAVSGLRVTTMYPITYAFIYPVYLQSGEEVEYDIQLQERDILTRYYWLDTDGQIYRIELYGYVRMPDTSFQMDLSTYTDIKNWSNTSAPMEIYEEYLTLNVGYGQNLIKGIAWYGASGWAPFKAYNLAAAAFMRFDLGYPLYPTISSGQSVPEIAKMGLMRGEEPKSPLENNEGRKDLQSSDSEDQIETTVNVIKGVGYTPTFNWWGPNAAEHNPEIYVATVAEVDSSNQFLKVIWKGMIQKGEISFPNLSVPLLESGKRYVFYVTAYSGDAATVTQDNVLWYPEDLNFWYSRSEGVLFEP
jgi:plastocyanin